MLPIGALAPVHPHVDRSHRVWPILGFHAEQQAGLGLHVRKERVDIAARGGADVLLREHAGDRPDVEVGQLVRKRLAVDADVAS